MMPAGGAMRNEDVRGGQVGNHLGILGLGVENVAAAPFVADAAFEPDE